jgi:hypothetical protein
LSQRDSLIKLQRTLESFLQRAVQQKQSRLSVLDGINRLDDIARDKGGGVEGAVGEWFARHNGQLESGDFRPGDIDRIGRIMSQIQRGLDTKGSSPELRKISSEIDRWGAAARPSSRSVTLKRGPESIAGEDDSVSLFGKTLARASGLYLEMSAGRSHLLSVLDESLKSAQIQKNREALLLSAFIIYYLRSGGYKVEPYVKRLKEAERLAKDAAAHA